MAGYWNEFLFRFCKVGFLCWQGEPNWLGLIVLGFAGLIVLYILLLIFYG